MTDGYDAKYEDIEPFGPCAECGEVVTELNGQVRHSRAYPEQPLHDICTP